MMHFIGRPGDTIELDTGLAVITLQCPAMFKRVFHADSMTTFEFVLVHHDVPVPRWKLTRLRVWKDGRDACADLEQRGSVVSIECDDLGGETEIMPHVLTLNAMDSLNICTLCLATYPNRSDAWHRKWQRRVFSETGQDSVAAQQIGLLAAYGLPGRNPEQNALVQIAADQNSEDVAAYIAESRKDHDD